MIKLLFFLIFIVMSSFVGLMLTFVAFFLWTECDFLNVKAPRLARFCRAGIIALVLLMWPAIVALWVLLAQK